MKKRFKIISSIMILSMIVFFLFNFNVLRIKAIENGDEIIVYNNGSNNANVIDIGTNSMVDFSDINYIDNANYFKVNPKHSKHDSNYNKIGTCTTIAMQLML